MFGYKLIMGLLALVIFWAQLGLRVIPFYFIPNTTGYGLYGHKGHGRTPDGAGPGIGPWRPVIAVHAQGVSRARQGRRH